MVLNQQQARERQAPTSAWMRGQTAIAVSIIGACMVMVAAVKSRWRQPARIALLLHALLALGIWSYWIAAGIPQPLAD